jgi:hypothetical protein
MPIVTVGTALARPAGLKDLDSDAIARPHAPPFFGAAADLFYDADALVTWNEGKPAEEKSRELFVIRAAQSARLNAQERVVVADLRSIELSPP